MQILLSLHRFLLEAILLKEAHLTLLNGIFRTSTSTSTSSNRTSKPDQKSTLVAGTHLESSSSYPVSITSFNPANIPSQWNIAFGGTNPPPTDPSTINPTPLRAPPPLMPHTSSSPPQPSHLSHLPQSLPPNSAYLPGTTPMTSTLTTSPPVPGPTFVSPTMWQESVASVYGQGMKRTWGDYGGAGILDGMGVNVKRSR